MNNPYQVLGIPASATDAEIKAAYRRLSKKYHPDLHQGARYYEEKFKEIQEAYEQLTRYKGSSRGYEEPEHAANDNTYTYSEPYQSTYQHRQYASTRNRRTARSRPWRFWVPITVWVLFRAISSLSDDSAGTFQDAQFVPLDSVTSRLVRNAIENDTAIIKLLDTARPMQP